MSPGAGDHHRGGAGTPVVLLHGAGSTWRVWRALLPAIERSHEVFAPTLAGHRGGPALLVEPRDTVRGIVDGVCRDLDAAGIDTAHVVGNSFGGWVALELARRGRARSVVGLSPAGAWNSPHDLSRLLHALGLSTAAGRSRTVRRLAAVPCVRRLLLGSVVPAPELLSAADVTEMLDDLAGCAAVATFVAGARAAGPIPPLRGTECPVRIAWGDRDRLLPFDRYGAPLLARLPGAELVMLPGMGHVPMLDDPAAVAATVLDLVDRTDHRRATELRSFHD